MFLLLNLKVFFLEKKSNLVWWQLFHQTDFNRYDQDVNVYHGNNDRSYLFGYKINIKHYMSLLSQSIYNV